MAAVTSVPHPRSPARREVLLTVVVASVGLLAVAAGIALGLAGVLGTGQALVLGVGVALPVTVAQSVGLRRLARST